MFPVSVKDYLMFAEKVRINLHVTFHLIWIYISRDYKPEYERLRKEKEEEELKQKEEQLERLRKDIQEDTAMDAGCKLMH